jgi:RND family efflux transporter MFP subunit
MALSPNSIHRASLCAALAAMMWLAVPSQAQDSTAPTVTGQTMPSMETKLSFAGPAVVMDILVKHGDHVKVGQVLAQQDDRQDQAALKSMQLEAESTLKIDYSTDDRDEKQLEYDRKEKMLKENVASVSEVDEARLAVDLAKTQIDLAVLEHSQKILDAQKQQFKVDGMKIISPIDGVVESLNIHPGEMADPQNRDGAITVVKNDPLWVVMHLPTTQSQQLKLGDAVQVKYSTDKDWQTAKIVFIKPQADAASDTQEVRAELANPNGKDSGLQVQVKLPNTVSAVAAGGNN